MTKKTGIAVAISVLFGAAGIIHSCVHAPYVLPAGERKSDPSICFEADILPIFVSNCAKGGCHDAQKGAGGYVLDNYQDIVRKGIVPGNIAASKIWDAIAIGGSSAKAMPEDAPPLNATQLDLIKRWIIAGAVDSGACNSSCDTSNYSYSGAIAPLMANYCTGCHNSPSAPGGSLMDYTSVKNAAVDGPLINNVLHTPGYNAMPPGEQLSQCQITQIEKWVAAGAPNN